MLRETEALLKAGADRTRLRILAMLREGPLCGCQIVAVLGLSQSTVSKHLALLAGAGLVSDERRGRYSYYSLAPLEKGGVGGRLLKLVGRGLSGDPIVERDAKECARKKIRDLAKGCVGGSSGRPGGRE